MPKVKILLVEDEPSMIEMYKTIFELAGYEVPVACDVEEGLKKIKEEKPDLILLDIVLGKEEPARKETLTAGFRLLKILKKDPKTKDIPVVVLTALGKQYESQSLKLGAEDYIIKAKFLPREIVRRVEKVLARHNII